MLMTSPLSTAVMLTGDMSDHTGHWKASWRGGCSKISAYTGQFEWTSMV